MSTQPSNPYREPTPRERERAATVAGRIRTAFGNKVPGGDAAAADSAEWVVAGFPWERPLDQNSVVRDVLLPLCDHLPGELPALIAWAPSELAKRIVKGLCDSGFTIARAAASGEGSDDGR